MSLDSKKQLDLLRLANSGASFALNCEKKTQLELVQIANAIRKGGGHLTVIGVTTKAQFDLVQITLAGRGHITLTA